MNREELEKDIEENFFILSSEFSLHNMFSFDHNGLCLGHSGLHFDHNELCSFFCDYQSGKYRDLWQKYWTELNKIIDVHYLPHLFQPYLPETFEYSEDIYACYALLRFFVINDFLDYLEGNGEL